MSRRRDNLKEVESSPDGRYIRFDEKLGTGAYKEVYLCYDTETGKEVAWNTVDLARLPPDEKKRIRGETEILKELEHPHIINFFTVWENEEKEQICFTTEIVTSGTLKQYISRVKGVKLKVIKKWCRQILNGLDYLHSHNPPIIHRDLKCDNIFINGSTGEIRIGDFGLSSMRHKTHAESVLGTPEFMAPELYEENYGESVDIYAFGMAVLEMATKEYPYEECTNAAQIWKRVSAGQKPEVLDRITDPQVHAFVEMCLWSVDLRPTARELLRHPFLSYKLSDPLREFKVVTVEPRVPHNGGSSTNNNPQTQSNANNNNNNNNSSNHHGHHNQSHNPSHGGQQSHYPPSVHNHGYPGMVQHPHDNFHPSNLYSNHAHSVHGHAGQNPNNPQQDKLAPRKSSASVNNNLNPGQSGIHGNGNRNVNASLQGQGQGQGQYVNYGQTAAVSRVGSLPSTVSINPNHRQSVPLLNNLPLASPTHGTHMNYNQAPASAPHHSHDPNNPNPSPSPSPPPASISQIVVDLESIADNIAHIVLHIHFDGRKKKQIKFDFDFQHDTYQSIAGEMVKALKLPDPARTTHLIAETMEAKLDSSRINYCSQHGLDPNSVHALTPTLLPSSSHTSSQNSQYSQGGHPARTNLVRQGSVPTNLYNMSHYPAQPNPNANIPHSHYIAHSQTLHHNHAHHSNSITLATMNSSVPTPNSLSRQSSQNSQNPQNVHPSQTQIPNNINANASASTPNMSHSSQSQSRMNHPHYQTINASSSSLNNRSSQPLPLDHHSNLNYNVNNSNSVPAGSSGHGSRSSSPSNHRIHNPNYSTMPLSSIQNANAGAQSARSNNPNTNYSNNSHHPNPHQQYSNLHQPLAQLSTNNTSPILAHPHSPSPSPPGSGTSSPTHDSNHPNPFSENNYLNPSQPVAIVSSPSEQYAKLQSEFMSLSVSKLKEIFKNEGGSVEELVAPMEKSFLVNEIIKLKFPNLSNLDLRPSSPSTKINQTNPAVYPPGIPRHPSGNSNDSPVNANTGSNGSSTPPRHLVQQQPGVGVQVQGQGPQSIPALNEKRASKNSINVAISPTNADNQLAHHNENNNSNNITLNNIPAPSLSRSNSSNSSSNQTTNKGTSHPPNNHKKQASIDFPDSHVHPPNNHSISSGTGTNTLTSSASMHELSNLTNSYGSIPHNNNIHHPGSLHIPLSATLPHPTLQNQGISPPVHNRSVTSFTGSSDELNLFDPLLREETSGSSKTQAASTPQAQSNTLSQRSAHTQGHTPYTHITAHGNVNSSVSFAPLPIPNSNSHVPQPQPSPSPSDSNEKKKMDRRKTLNQEAASAEGKILGLNLSSVKKSQPESSNSNGSITSASSSPSPSGLGLGMTLGSGTAPLPLNNKMSNNSTTNNSNPKSPLNSPSPLLGPGLSSAPSPPSSFDRISSRSPPHLTRDQDSILN